MRERCLNPKHKRYPRYGGRGIKVCREWATFDQFLADMGPKSIPDFEIDRIDNDGHYSPENCRWSSKLEQAQNKSNNRVVTYNNVTLPLAEWARRVGLKWTTLRNRLDTEWSVEKALTTPTRKAPVVK